MNDSLEMLRRSSATNAHQERALGTRGPEAPESEEEACSAFGYLRGVRDRASMIEFRLGNGNSKAFPYSWLGPVSYDPSAGLLLKFVGDLVYLVLIEGSNLNAPVNGSTTLNDRGLQRHRVVWIREMSSQEVQRARAGEIVIQRIRMLAHRPDEEPKDVEWLRAFQGGG